jgi:hypothetical protein
VKIGKPTELQAEWLAKLGLPGLANFELPDDEVIEAHQVVKQQHGIKRFGHAPPASADVICARAIARVAYRHYGRKKLADQAPHPYLRDMNRKVNRLILVIIALLLILLVLAVTRGHAQTNKANPGPPARANMFYWNGTAYVPVETGSPFPITCVSGCSAAGAFTDNSAFTVNTSAISPMGCYYTSGAAPAISSGNAGRCTMDVFSNVNMNCQVGCAGAAGRISTSGTLGALNAAVAVNLDKYNGSGFAVTSGSLTGNITPQVSFDGGTNWKPTYFIDLTTTGNLLTFALNPSSGLGYTVVIPQGATNARVIVTSYVSGSVGATIYAMTGNSLPVSLTSDWTTGVLQPTWSNAASGGAFVELRDGQGNNRSAYVNSSNQLTVAAFQGTSPWVVSASGNFGVTQQTSPWVVAGGLTENNATPPASQLAVMPCRADTAARSVTVTFQVLLSCDGNDLLRVSVKDTPSNTNNFNVNLAASAATVTVTGTVAATQSGNWTSRIVGNAGGVMDAAGQNATFPANWLGTGCEFTTVPTTITTGKGSPLSCDAANNLFVNLATAIPAGGNTIGAVTGSGNFTVVQSTGTNLHIVCDGGTCGGSSPFADNATFTEGTSSVTPIACEYVSGGAGNLTTGHAGAPQCTIDRKLYVQDFLAQWGGTALGTPTNFGTTPGAVIAGSVNASLFSGTTALGTPNTFGTTAPTGNALGVNASLFVGTTLAITDGTAGVAAVGGHIANNATAIGTSFIPSLIGVSQSGAAGGTAYTAGRFVAPDIFTDGALHVAAIPALRPASFHASASFAGSSTTVASHIIGNATNMVEVTKVMFTCTQTTAGALTVTVNKTSAASSGGTAATMTVVPDDSQYSAGSGSAQSFTGTGPTAGTPVGQIDAQKIGCNATGTAGPNDIYVLDLRQKPIVLRSTSQTLEIGVGGATTGGNYTVTWEWIETPIVTE